MADHDETTGNVTADELRLLIAGLECFLEFLEPSV